MSIPTEDVLRTMAAALAAAHDQLADCAADCDNAAEDAARDLDAASATEAARMAEALWRLAVQARRASDELDGFADRVAQLTARRERAAATAK